VREQRKKIWIDDFQTYLSVRIVIYFVLYQFAIWFLVAIQSRLSALEGPMGTALASYGYLLTWGTMIVLAILFIRDALRLSHRIVGPLYRFRKTIRAVTAGEEVSLVNLRAGDHLLDMKDDLNELLMLLEQRGVVVLKAAETPQDQHQPVPA
jgi:hypothetical protein